MRFMIKQALFFIIFILFAGSAFSASRVFYDGFESGNTNLWGQVDWRDKCEVVMSPGDGGVGPQSGSRFARCNFNGTLEWNAPARYQSMSLPLVSGNEIFYRLYMRISPNLNSNTGGGPKLFRFWNQSGYAAYLGLHSVDPASEPAEAGWQSDTPYDPTHWGMTTLPRTSWAKYEMYFNRSTNLHRIWVNGTLVRNTSAVNLSGVTASEFQITSNWSGVEGTLIHDTTNHVYFDEFEVYSDLNSGTPATGSMENATITVETTDTTPPVISSPQPSGVQPYGTTSVTLQVTTNEAATCRYHTSDVAYASMGSTFGSTGGTTHQQSGFATTNGTSYTRYVRCIDSSNNANTTSTVINFSISGTPGGPVVRNECANPPSGTVFCADFEEVSDAARRAVWDDYDGATDVVFATDVGPSQDGANTVARFLAGSGQPYGADLVKVLPSTYDKLYLRYYQFFDDGYSLAWGGHGGGLTAGSRSYLGSSGSRPSGSDFANFALEYSTAGELRGYSYYRGMYQDCSNPVGSCWGDSFPCNYDSGASYCIKPHHIKHPSVSWPTFSTGTWRCIEEMIDMGGTATANLDGTDPDGRYQIFVDGVPLGDYEDLWLRTTTNLKLQNLYMAWRNTSGTQHGSVGQRFDNIVVSTQRVGCGTSTTDKIAPVASAVLPTGTVSSPATLSFSTGEVCAAAHSPTRVGHRYKTPFTSTNSTSHSASVVYLDGSKTEHYTCMDAAGNISIPVTASFSVAGTDVIAPTVNSRVIPSAGTTLVMGFDEAVTFAGAVPTLTECSGGATTLTYASGSGGASLTFNVSRTVLSAETGCVNSYTQSGNGIEDLAGNDLASFSNQAVTNNSTQVPADITPPSVTIATADPSNIITDSLTVTGSASDAVGVSGCKWRRTSAPDADNGTACTGTTSFSCETSGYAEGANTLYVGCYDAAGNYGSDSITVNLDSGTPGDMVLSALLPTSGTKLARTATTTTIGVTTSVAATCRWGNSPNLLWANLVAYTTTGGTSHSSALAVVAGGVYQVCSRCYNAVAELFSGDSCTNFSVTPKPKFRVGR